MAYLQGPSSLAELGGIITLPALLYGGGYEATPINPDQQGDLYLFQTDDDGDVEIENGLVTLTTGLETAIYLSLFGGSDYWANLDETEPDMQYTSATGEFVASAPLTSGNLRALVDIVKQDLQWLGSADVTVEVKGTNSVYLTIDLVSGENLSIYAPWGTE